MVRLHGLHPDFQPAAWRGTNMSDGKIIGISFDLANGEIIRLAIDAKSARAAAETLLDHLDAAARTNTQSASASGNPSVDVSAHNECEKA